jgi:rod shape-determining protein MreC
MRNFLAFFRRFRVFLFFAFLQIIALSLHIRYLSFPKNQYLTTASAVTGKILEAENDVTKHFNLSKNNSELQQENIKLRTKIPESFYKVGRNLYKIEDTLYEQQFEYIPASVINSSVTRRNNYFTIDVGTKQGIKREMGVFSDKGVVGVIHNVSEHYSVVKTVLTKDINIDVTIEPIGLFGFLKWDGHNPKKGSVTGISNDLKIKRWSRVVTKGGSGIFPKGMPVGKVYETLPVEGEPLWDVVVKFSENFRTLQRVYVIKNLLIDEQKALERRIPQDEEDEDL